MERVIKAFRKIKKSNSSLTKGRLKGCFKVNHKVQTLLDVKRTM